MLKNNVCQAKVNVLAFGDSNTWGYQPSSGLRYARDKRWPSLLDSMLGPNFHVVENGLNGRTTRLDEDGRADRNGLRLLPVTLEMATPLDIVIVMLGTNDLKPQYNQSAEDIGVSIAHVCRTIKRHPNIDVACRIILVSPTLVTTQLGPSTKNLASCFSRSEQFSQVYQNVAEQLNIDFLDASSIVHTEGAPDSDGVHWQAYQHHDFAKALCLYIQGLRLNLESSV